MGHEVTIEEQDEYIKLIENQNESLEDSIKSLEDLSNQQGILEKHLTQKIEQRIKELTALKELLTNQPQNNELVGIKKKITNIIAILNSDEIAS